MSSHTTARIVSTTLIAIAVCLSGCRSGKTPNQRFSQAPLDYFGVVGRTAQASFSAPVDDSDAEPPSVEEYIQLGLMQNPEIQEARLMVASIFHRLPQAASLPDPMLGATAFTSPVQTAAGEQDFALSMSQQVPWRGKLATGAAIARQDVNAARARLSAVELKVAEQIRIAYYKLYFVQQAISITEEDQKQLKLIEEVVDRMYRVKREVTQQDLLQVQVQQSRVESELLSLRQQKKSAQARLARQIHVSPQTHLAAAENLPKQQIVQDVELLYERAIQSRPELHEQLASIARARNATCLAQLNNYPDLTFGFNWIATSNDGISPVANGDDAFMLTLGMNLPINKKRIGAGVREAQTRAMADVHKYDRLKDETLEVVTDLFAKIASQRETLELFCDDIIPNTQRILDQSIDDYQVGKVDFLQMIENWRQLLRYHVAEKRLESELHQSLASLTRQIGCTDFPVTERADQP